jgi:hypothetical protein
MKAGKDEMIENQKKMFGAWKEWTDQWMKSIPNMQTPSTNTDFFVPWMDMQRKWLDDTMKMGSMEGAPQQWNEWMNAQSKMSEKWMDMFQNQSKQMGGVMEHPLGPKQWQDWMAESNKWIKNNILDKIPANMKPHYSNFTVLYDEMAKYWEPIQRMIQFGATSKNAADQFINPDTYRRIVGLYMGFKPVDNTAKLVDDVNTFFEDYIASLQKMTPGTHQFMDSWTRFFRDWGRQTGHPGLEGIGEMTNMIEKGLNSFYHVAGPSEELAMAKIIKDIQFAYTGFLLKSSEMQQVFLDASQFALPDTMKSFYEEFEKTHKMPNYNEFFQRFTNIMEDYLMEVLESKEYSVLQADVSKMGIAVKSKMDELVELSFKDFPFLMKSFADEVAKENTTLRRKVRDLEHRLYALESSIMGGVSLPKGKAEQEVKPTAKAAPAKAAPAKTTPAKKTTAK